MRYIFYTYLLFRKTCILYNMKKYYNIQNNDKTINNDKNNDINKINNNEKTSDIIICF
jgi:hypothetical protein